MKPDTPKFEMPAEIWAISGSEGVTGGSYDTHPTDPKYKRLPYAKYIRADLAAAPKPDCVGVEELKRKICAHLGYSGKSSVGVKIVNYTIIYLASQGLLAVKGRPEISDESGDLHIAYMVGFEKGKDSVKEKSQQDSSGAYGSANIPLRGDEPTGNEGSPEHRTDTTCNNKESPQD